MPNETPKPRTPEFDFCALNKVTGERGRLGAAWLNEDGTISIVLNFMVQVPTGKEWVLSLLKR